MTFDPTSYVPEPNEWLSISAKHRGRAKLRFRDPAGSVGGDAELTFDETGEVRIEVRLDPATLEVESGTSRGLLPFIWPGRSKVVDGREIEIRSFGDELNPCSRLEIETHEGLLVTEEIDEYRSHTIMGDGKDELKLEFEPHFGLAFDVVGAGQPMYWALPLLNFVSRFRQRSPTTNRHPLRVYPTPVVPDGLPEEEREAAVDAANEHNWLILFEFADRPGFVERLVGYQECVEALRQGRTRSAATAVVVGEIGDRDPQDLENSFPSDVAALLSLASGSEVSAPSIEFRDEEGRLARRVHYHLSPSPYLEGHRSIRDRLSAGSSLRGTGLLLTQATSSAENGIGEAYLRVAIRHLVRAGSDARTIDEQMAYLCRCLDNICKRFEVDQQNLRASLTEQELDDVTNALDAASRVIRPLANNSRASGRADAARVLNRIAERARQASNLEKQFGLAVVDLLRVPRISLPDSDIVDAYYAANPLGAGTRSWSSVLSTYRGDVIHQGYIPFSEGERDVEDAVRIVRHLYDVSVRVIFKILEYNGKYRPRISSSTKTVDWVDATTTPEDLGFK